MDEHHHELYDELPKKQQQLLITAEELFHKHGFKRITIEEICKKSNVSKMTFYKYFPNKMELVKFLLSMWSAEAFQKIHSIDGEYSSFIEQVERLTEIKIEATEKFSTEFIEDLLYADEELGKLLSDIRKKNYAKFVKFFEEAKRRGEIRDDVSSEFVIYALDMMTTVSKDKKLARLFPNYTEFTRSIFNFLFYGIAGKLPAHHKPEGIKQE